MQQLIHVHGGEIFPNDDAFCEALATWEYKPFEHRKRWRNRLQEQLTGEYEMFFPDMPCYKNAKYRAWKIWFEKVLPFLNDEELILTGGSLGATFLAKYLSENVFPKRISQLHLVAGVFDGTDRDGKDGYMGDFAFDPAGLKNLAKQADKIFLYHSKDDDIVPFSHLGKFASYLPDAEVMVFEDRGHFKYQEFPEILANIRKSQK